MTKDPIIRPSIPMENLELPPLNKRVVENFVARLKATAAKGCDVHNCTQPAEFWITELEYCACETHRGVLKARPI